MIDYLSATVFWAFLWRVRKTQANSAGSPSKALSPDLVIPGGRGESHMMPCGHVIRFYSCDTVNVLPGVIYTGMMEEPCRSQR